MKIEELETEQIEEFCKVNKVKSLFAFGSVIRDDFNKKSDIDLIVDFDETDPFKYTDLYFNLKSNLEKISNQLVFLVQSKCQYHFPQYGNCQNRIRIN